MNLFGDSMIVNTDMLDPNKLTTINRNLIDSIEPSKVSMMPEGLIDTFQPDEILDLVGVSLFTRRPQPQDVSQRVTQGLVGWVKRSEAHHERQMTRWVERSEAHHERHHERQMTRWVERSEAHHERHHERQMTRWASRCSTHPTISSS